jgi:hypothetical protein
LSDKYGSWSEFDYQTLKTKTQSNQKMSLNLSELRGQELAKKLGEYRIQYEKEKNDWEYFVAEIIQFQACFYRVCFCCPSSPPSRPVRKKGSLKPSKPLTDEERNQIFGNQSSKNSSDDEKVTTTKRTKKVAKKKKSKAPNAIRKTKKHARL